MTPCLPKISLAPCKKGYVRDLDKAVSPKETVDRVLARLEQLDLDILAETRRVDTGRLGIPVYMSMCGQDARAIMPTRKQMGKGSSPEQARASAVMELVERFSYFTYLKESPHALSLTWSEAEAHFNETLIPLADILRSVNEELDCDSARAVLDTVRWSFHPATELGGGNLVWLPLDWFRMLNEFNGTSAGNTEEESLLQGLCELVERHVCAEIDSRRLKTPTISTADCQDATLNDLCAAFRRENIRLVLKNFSLDMPLVTVGAIAYDPATFPERSEIVFTAGTASSATKAAIRAITEVAQLAGDFCTKSCYEASGLPKFHHPAEAAWLLEGEEINIRDIQDIVSDDITEELLTAVRRLSPRPVYALRTTSPLLMIPTHYTIVPGLSFRERDKNASLGLFVGRRLAENEETTVALKGFECIQKVYGQSHFLPFFQGLLALRSGDVDQALSFLKASVPLQPDDDARALALFYSGYAETTRGNYAAALPYLEEANQLSPSSSEYGNLLGVALYKTSDFARAEEVFRHVLSINKGSAMDLANLGLCEKAQGKKAPALERLGQAIALDPSLDFARAHLAELKKFQN